MGLVIKRKLGEKFWIEDACVEVVEIREGRVRLCIAAPSTMHIVRDEIRHKKPKPAIKTSEQKTTE